MGSSFSWHVSELRHQSKMYNLDHSTNQHLDHVLFGNMLGRRRRRKTLDGWAESRIFVTAFLVLKVEKTLTSCCHAFDPATGTGKRAAHGVLLQLWVAWQFCRADHRATLERDGA